MSEKKVESQNLEEKKAETSKMAEGKVVEEKKVEEKPKKNGSGKKNGRKNGKLKRLVYQEIERRLEECGIDMDDIERLKQMAAEIKELNAKMQEIVKRRTEIREAVHYILDSIDEDTRKLLEFLKIVNFKEIVDSIYPSEERKSTGRKSAGGRTKRGNGLSGKTIVYEGQEYRQATYFMRKHGITGGMEGLKGWAEGQGLTVRVEGDTIYIE